MVSFEGVKECVVTFRNSVTSPPVVGTPVKISANGEICNCITSDKFVGVSLGSDGVYSSVLISGYVKLNYTGANPGFGMNKFSSNGAGGVKPDSSGGRDVIVVEVDTENKTVGLIIIS